jgi:hypothetical protein
MPDDNQGGAWLGCWYCLGKGGFHDCGDGCGDDSDGGLCSCRNPQLDLNVPCQECDGKGGHFVKTLQSRRDHPMNKKTETQTTPRLAEDKYAELRAMKRVFNALEELDAVAQSRVIAWSVSRFLGYAGQVEMAGGHLYGATAKPPCKPAAQADTWQPITDEKGQP